MQQVGETKKHPDWTFDENCDDKNGIRACHSDQNNQTLGWTLDKHLLRLTD